MKVYLDVAVITNTVVTLLCLEITAKLLHRRISNKRLFIASTVGGLMSLLIIVPTISYPAAVAVTAAKILGMPLITVLAFKFKGFALLIKSTIIFTLSQFVYTAVVLILWDLSDSKLIYVRNYTIYFNISIMQITLAIILTYVLLTIVEIIRRTSNSSGSFNATYTCGNYQLTLPAIADTGNKLCDSFSGESVVILYCDDLYYHFGLDMPDSLASGKFRLLPFETIGGSGIIAVTYMGNVVIANERSVYSDVRCCIGIAKSEGKRARAIFNPEIIN